MEPRVGGMKSSQFFQGDIKMLADAAARGDVDSIKSLVDAGVDVNSVGANRMSPLLWALGSENKDGIEMLLKLGADPDQEADLKKSAMSVAAGMPAPELLELLLRYGGNPNLVDAEGSLLHTAVHFMRFENVKVLLKYGADPNKGDGSGLRSAGLAIALGRYDMAYYFLENGLSSNLDELLASAKRRSVRKDSIQVEWREKVINKLESMGVVAKKYKKVGRR
jgi:ankyrin repeat protein